MSLPVAFVAFVIGPLVLPKGNYPCNILQVWRSVPKKYGNKVCILFLLQMDQWYTIVITKVVSLSRCDLFLFILVTHIKYLDYCKIVEENFNFLRGLD